MAVHPDFDIALRELIENAIIHNDTTRNTTITLSTEVTDTHVRLQITDNGPGIPENEIAILRTGGETDLHHSTGVGLWLVRQLLAQMDGSLEIEAESTGTRIDIQLPRNSEKS